MIFLNELGMENWKHVPTPLLVDDKLSLQEGYPFGPGQMMLQAVEVYVVEVL